MTSTSTRLPPRRRPPREEGERRTLGGIVLTPFKVLAVIIPVVAGLLGIVFLLWPDAKPQGAPTQKGADLGDITIEPMTFGTYLERVELPAGTLSDAAKAQRGVMTQFDATMRGYKGDDLTPRWQLVSTRDGRQIKHSRATTLRPEANEDQVSFFFFVPVPKAPATRCYRVIVQLYREGSLVPIRPIRSERFRGQAATSCGPATGA